MGKIRKPKVIKFEPMTLGDYYKQETRNVCNENPRDKGFIIHMKIGDDIEYRTWSRKEPKISY